MLGRNKKQRAVQLTYVPNASSKSTPDEDKELKPETVNLIAEKTKEVAKFVAITAVAAYAAVRTIDTLSQIAVKKTKSGDNEN